MQQKIKFKTIFKIVLIQLILVLITIPSVLKGDDKFLLNNLEMKNFTLIKVSSKIWVINKDGTNKEAIRQKWQDSNNNYIYIDYCIFNNISEAIEGTINAARDNASPYIWGAFNGSILGDASWIGSGNGAMYFVKGNVGVKIYKPTGPKDNITLSVIFSKIINKIQLNLSPEILSYNKKIIDDKIIENHQQISEIISKLNLMDKYKQNSTAKSKWPINDKSLSIGLRKEWKNENGAIIGVDINRFESNSEAIKASQSMITSNQIFNGIFHFKNVGSLKSLLEKWKKICDVGLRNDYLSIVGINDNVAVHVYQFNPTGIDTNITYLLFEKMLEIL